MRYPIIKKYQPVSEPGSRLTGYISIGTRLSGLGTEKQQQQFRIQKSNSIFIRPSTKQESKHTKSSH
jgi:hypothetical protein